MPSQEEQVGHKLEFIQLKHCLQKEIKKRKEKRERNLAQSLFQQGLVKLLFSAGILTTISFFWLGGVGGVGWRGLDPLSILLQGSDC